MFRRRATTDIDKGEVTLKFKIEGTEGKERTEGTVEIENPVNPVQNNSAPLRLCVKESFIPNESITIKLPAPVALWSPEEPNLYHFTARYGRDRISGYFAMRKFEKRRDA